MKNYQCWALMMAMFASGVRADGDKLTAWLMFGVAVVYLFWTWTKDGE